MLLLPYSTISICGACWTTITKTVGNSYYCPSSPCPTSAIFRQQQQRRRSLLTTTGLLAASDHAEETGSTGEASSSKPPLQSRLARLAEDWLEEEEEEDELSLYWERFEENKQDGAAAATTEEEEEADPAEPFLTTERRLERYYDGRCINRQQEREHAPDIQEAVRRARRAETASEAVEILRHPDVRPWLQVHTRLGGHALLELATALWQQHREEHDNDDDKGEERYDEAVSLCVALRSNPHVRRKVRALEQRGPPPRRGNKNGGVGSLWRGSFLDSDALTSWWD